MYFFPPSLNCSQSYSEVQYTFYFVYNFGKSFHFKRSFLKSSLDLGAGGGGISTSSENPGGGGPFTELTPGNPGGGGPFICCLTEVGIKFIRGFCSVLGTIFFLAADKRSLFIFDVSFLSDLEGGAEIATDI